MGDETGRLIHADALEALAELDAESIAAVVTDPPYGLEFMGKEWDSFRVDDRVARWSGEASGSAGGFGTIPGGSSLPQYTRRRTTATCLTCGKRDAFRNPHACGDAADWRTIPVGDLPIEARAFQNWCAMWATECLRVLKPGGYLLAFGGTRTYHRLACAVEDAGFDVRDMIEWVYGSGFPKSLDVSKQIDKTAGHWRGRAGDVVGQSVAMSGPHYERTEKGDPITAAAAAWEGWGTALKPAHEPIVVARKPLVGTVAENVLAHGTGAINIDATRVEGQRHGYPGGVGGFTFGGGARRGADDSEEPHPGGRWPPNVVLGHADSCTPEGCGEGCPVPLVAEQGGGWWGSRVVVNRNQEPGSMPPPGSSWSKPRAGGDDVEMDAGTAARFFPQFSHVSDEDAVSFRYTPKASTAQRNAGMEGMPEALPDSTPRPNVHPTVKPVGLMRWLVRLVVPPDGVVLDPFLGSGTTAVAAIAEDRAWVGVEREAEYATIAAARVAAAEAAVAARRLRERYEASKARDR